MRALSRGIALLSGWTVLLACPAPAQVWSPDGRTLAFFYIADVEDVYLIQPDGTGLRTVVGHPARDFGPEWFPDGRSLVFTSVRDGSHQVYAVNIDSGVERRLTADSLGGADASPHPRTGLLVFSRGVGKQRSLWVMEPDGGPPRQVFDSAGFDSYTPRWSPDGTRILFVGGQSGGSSDLWILPSAGGSPRQLTHTDGVDEFHPSWSPDGGSVAFIRVVGGEFELHTVRIDGTDDRIVVARKGYQAFYPHWSPDGQEIAFTRDVSSGVEAGLPGLFIVNLRTGAERRLTP